jgi:Zn-dependent protease with chaperone function
MMLSDVFHVTVFGLDAPGVSRPGSVHLQPQGLFVQLADGEERVIPYQVLHPSLGGTEEEHLILQFGEGPGMLLLYFERRDRSRLLAAAPPELRAQLASVEEAARRQDGWRVGAWAFGLLVTAGIAVLLWIGYLGLVDRAVTRIPREWERKIGASALEQALEGKTRVKDPTILAATRAVQARLEEAIPKAPYAFTVTIVEDPSMNAFALPGGQIVIYTGLLARAESPEEYAGVLAHEMQHVLARHGLTRVVRDLGLAVLAQLALGGAGDAWGLVLGQAPRLLSLQFSRAQEFEADAGGVKLLTAAKIRPDGLRTFFARLARKEGGMSNSLAFLSTHPTSKARLDRLSRLTRGKPALPPLTLPVAWQQVRAKSQEAL